MCTAQAIHLLLEVCCVSMQFSENAAQFKCLGTTVTNQNLIQAEIKSRLDLGNACCHSIQNLLSSHLLSKNIKN
jgi:hypothetical protein